MSTTPERARARSSRSFAWVPTFCTACTMTASYPKQGRLTRTELSGSPDLVGSEAPRAHGHFAGNAVHQDAHLLHVGVPPPASAPVRVRDVVPEAGSLSTDVTNRCHKAKEITRGPRFRPAALARLPSGWPPSPLCRGY